jgi:NAD(P)-dependent dehydrogenase (short-subunit alcohol dehydrogenase family)
MAERLGAAGLVLGIVDRDRPALEQAVTELRRDGLTVSGFAADVSREEEVRELARRVAAELGLASILVNNAGFTHVGPTLDLTLEGWQQSIAMATGVFLCCREFGRQMRDRGEGRILNISSINARIHFPMRMAYDAAKAAVESMTQSLAIEWAGYGIRVNAIAPGVTDTRMLRDAIADGAIDADAYLGRVPQRRFGSPHEIADAAYYLVSDQSTFVTGQVLTVDGGWSAFGWIPWSNDPDRP